MRALITIPKVTDLFTPLLFCYFATLHADQLHLHVGVNIRLNNLLAFALVALLLVRMRTHLILFEGWLAKALTAIGVSLLLSLCFSPHKASCSLFLFWLLFTFVCNFWLPYQLIALFGAAHILNLYFASFVAVGCYALWQFLSGFLGFMDPFVTQFLSPHIARPDAFAYEPSYYCLYMTPFIIIQTVLHLREKRGKRLLFYNCFYFICASAALCYSYIFFFSFTALYRRYRKALRRFFALFVLMITPFALLFSSILVSHLLKGLVVGKKYESITERHANNMDCLRLFAQRPFCGYGYGGVRQERIDQGLVYKGVLSSLEKARRQGGVATKIAEPSNVSTEILASLGIIGFLAFAALLLAYGVRYARAQPHPLHDAFFLSVIVMLLIWQFNQGLLRTYTWTHFALACALLRTTLPSELTPPQEVCEKKRGRALLTVL